MWPNGLTSFLTSARKSQKTHFKANISCISLANNGLMDVTQLSFTWVGWPNGEKFNCVDLGANLNSTKVNASHRKSTQVNASAAKTWPNGVASGPKFSTCVYSSPLHPPIPTLTVNPDSSSGGVLYPVPSA